MVVPSFSPLLGSSSPNALILKEQAIDIATGFHDQIPDITIKWYNKSRITQVVGTLKVP